jgi:hypothetical protein
MRKYCLQKSRCIISLVIENLERSSRMNVMGRLACSSYGVRELVEQADLVCNCSNGLVKGLVYGEYRLMGIWRLQMAQNG